MSDWKPIFLLARTPLILLAMVVLLALAGVIGMHYAQDKIQTMLLQLQAGLQEQQAQLDIRKTDLKNMESHIKRYESLRAQGLVGDPDRALWVEQLQASRARLALPDAFSVELQAAKPLGGAALAAVEEGAPPQPLEHDLEFEMHGVHEQEVLALVQDFRSQARGRFRVQNCNLQEPKDTGLSARCKLRFVTIPAMASALTPPGVSP